MEPNCNWCNKETPYVHVAKVRVLNCSNNHLGIKPQELVICKDCEQDLKEYERSWELLSR